MAQATRVQGARAPAARRRSESESSRLIERFAPDAPLGESHDILVRAPADLVFDVAENLDLMSMSGIYTIFWLRARVMKAPAPERGDLRGLVSETKKMGWGELARRPGREVVMGAAVRPWLPEPIFEPIPPERFLTYDPPEHVKIVWTLEAEPLGPQLTRFRTETRVVPTDEAGARRFRRYWRLAGTGIVLVRLLALPAIRREAERRVREERMSGARTGGLSHTPAPLLESLLPDFEATVIREKAVQAPPDVTYAAIEDTNLLDPLVRALFGVRELPARVRDRIHGETRPRQPRSITMNELAGPDTGMVRLAENPGREIVLGSVGRFWERDYGHREVGAEEFVRFEEAGYAKLAMAISVRPDGEGGSVLRYEARTATTDEEAHRHFHRYWRIIHPGVWLVMGRALGLIAKEAERRATYGPTVIL